MTTTTLKTPATAAVTPTARVLTASLIAGPLIYLAADSMYAARGWDDATAGVLHVLGAIGYGFVVLAVATWLRRDSWLTAVLVVTGLIGMAGNVAYGFDTIHQSFGDIALVDRAGAANLIKPLGLFFPLSLFAAAVAWPLAHIANLAEVAVPVNVALTLACGSLALGAADLQRAPGSAERAPAS